MRGRYPGDVLLRPVTLGSVFLVIVNDRLLKTQYPSTLSGKLSDFAGLVMFPLMVVGIWELLRSRWREDWELPLSCTTWVVAVEAVIFALIKIWTPAADVYRTVVGAALWVVKGGGELNQALHVEDLTDLIALVVLPIPILVVRRLKTGSGRPAKVGHP